MPQPSKQASTKSAFSPSLGKAAVVFGLTAVAALYFFPSALYIATQASLAAKLSSFVAAAYVNVVSTVTVLSGGFALAAAITIAAGKVGSKILGKCFGGSAKPNHNAVKNDNLVFDSDEEFKNETQAKVHKSPLLQEPRHTKSPVGLGSNPPVVDDAPVEPKERVLSPVA
jgi:hypothetical protein